MYGFNPYQRSTTIINKVINKLKSKNIIIQAPPKYKKKAKTYRLDTNCKETNYILKKFKNHGIIINIHHLTVNKLLELSVKINVS